MEASSKNITASFHKISNAQTQQKSHLYGEIYGSISLPPMYSVKHQNRKQKNITSLKFLNFILSLLFPNLTLGRVYIPLSGKMTLNLLHRHLKNDQCAKRKLQGIFFYQRYPKINIKQAKEKTVKQFTQILISLCLLLKTCILYLRQFRCY